VVCLVYFSEDSFLDILLRLCSKIDTDGRDGTKNIVNVERMNVLDGGFRAFSRPKFDPTRQLSVKFSGEDGVDTGGLTREFLRLALVGIQNLPIFCGPADGRNMALDYKGTALRFCLCQRYSVKETAKRNWLELVFWFICPTKVTNLLYVQIDYQFTYCT